MYTSGTTGHPKGAVLTHANLTWNALNTLIDLDLTSDERALACAPLFHAAGLGMLALPTLLKGGTCVIAAFDPARTLELIEEYAITFMFGVPTMYDLMARHPAWAAADLSSLRTALCGGAPVPTSLIDTYRERGLTLREGYGMTEASPGVLLDVDEARGGPVAAAMAAPHFFTDIRVVRPDMTAVDVGETGEVLVRGPHVMPGYWGLPDATAAAFRDGWFRSGDVARLDEDGHVHIVDRIKDVIISGGENVYPAEIEDLLLAHPDIAECAVIGVPDPTWGEVPRAVLVPRRNTHPDPDEILGYLARHVAKYKVPKSVVLTDELPRTASGKPLKSRVRELHGIEPSELLRDSDGTSRARRTT